MSTAIEIRNVSKSFGRGGEKVLSGVDLSVPSGGISYLLGPSGTGKSVLLKHIVALLKPDSGEIRVFGNEIPYRSAKKLNEMRKRFGVLFQGAALFDTMTVYQNVAFPLEAHRRELSDASKRSLVSETLQSVGFDPSGNLEKFPSQLSGGMQKRVGLARAIILKPEVILYDEPTTGLDPVTRLTVEEMIGETKTKLGLTSFVISHDISAAMTLADQIAFLYGGKVVFHGSPEQFAESEHPVIQSFLRAERSLGSWGKKDEA